jgi:hypothetical protein
VRLSFSGAGQSGRRPPRCKRRPITTQSKVKEENDMNQQSGWVWINSAGGDPDWVLDIAGKNPGDGIMLNGQVEQDSQYWDIFTAQGDPGYFHIGNKLTQLVISVPAIRGDEARVFLSGLGPWDTQKWRFEPGIHGNYVINKFSGLVLDVEHANYAQGTSIIQYLRNGGLNQQWGTMSPSELPNC